MDMCGICVMCWICVGYVWCEIRQQSSEETCDETSFGKNCAVVPTLWSSARCRPLKVDTDRGSACFLTSNMEMFCCGYSGFCCFFLCCCHVFISLSNPIASV